MTSVPSGADGTGRGAPGAGRINQGGLPMRIKFCTQQVDMGSRKLLELSQTVRQCRDEAEEVRRQLQQLTGMDECRSAISRMEESMALVTARVAGLSSALGEISGLYSGAERRNADALEKCPSPIRETAAAPGCGSRSTQAQ